MEFIKVKTRPFLPPQDDIYGLMEKYLPKLSDKDILVVTSKALSIHQGRCIKINAAADKKKLVINEAEKYIPGKRGEKSIFTIKNSTIVTAAGIDESNGNGYYILRPEKLEKSAEEICSYLKKKYALKNLGVIITDSVSSPLRYGATGVAIGFYGIKPLKDYRGDRDVFGRKFKFERANLVDPLAAASVLLMGEGKERIPMLIIRGADFINFKDRKMHSELFVPEKKDKFNSLLKIFKNKRKV